MPRVMTPKMSELGRMIAVLATAICVTTREIGLLMQTRHDKWIVPVTKGRCGRYGAGGRPEEDSIQYGKMCFAREWNRGEDETETSFSDEETERFDNISALIEKKQEWLASVLQEAKEQTEKVEQLNGELNEILTVQAEMLEKFGSCDRGTENTVLKIMRQLDWAEEKEGEKLAIAKDIHDQIEALEDNQKDIELGEFRNDTDMWTPDMGGYNSTHWNEVWRNGERILARVMANTAKPKKLLSLNLLFSIGKWINEQRFGTSKDKINKKGIGMTYYHYALCKAQIQMGIARIIPNKEVTKNGKTRTNLEIAKYWMAEARRQKEAHAELPELPVKEVPLNTKFHGNTGIGTEDKIIEKIDRERDYIKFGKDLWDEEYCERIHDDQEQFAADQAEYIITVFAEVKSYRKLGMLLSVSDKTAKKRFLEAVGLALDWEF
jgi:hypothetical protein